MAKPLQILILVLFPLTFCHESYADFLGLSSTNGRSKIPQIIEKLKKIKIEPGPVFEDQFNQLVKLLEMTIEEEKSFCSGDSADQNGKVISKDQRQVCFRDLKTHYLEAMETVYSLKKKYLAAIHQRQIDELNTIQSRLKSDIEKSF